MPDIRLEHISFSYHRQNVLRDITFTIKTGEFISILGPNGVGKSTLIRLIARTLIQESGEIYLDDISNSNLTRKELAKRIAVVPQNEKIIFPFSVQEVVLMGRTPHLSGWVFETKRDKEIARRAMTMTDVVHLAARPMTQLSGGEQHRVSIARALAQQTPILLLDEPNAHLDIQHQIELFNLLHFLHRERGKTIICVSHDINLASQYSDRIALLSGKTLFALGTPNEVVTTENISQVFNVTTEISYESENPPHIKLNRGILREEVQASVHELETEISSLTLNRKTNNQRKFDKVLLWSALVVEPLTYFYLLSIRYSNQHLPFSSIDFVHPANIFTGLCAFTMMSALFANLLSHVRTNDKFPKIQIIISLLGIVFLLWSFYPSLWIQYLSVFLFVMLKSYQFGYACSQIVIRKKRRHFYLFSSTSIAGITCIILFSIASIYSWFSIGNRGQQVKSTSFDLLVVLPSALPGIDSSESLYRLYDTILPIAQKNSHANILFLQLDDGVSIKQVPTCRNTMISEGIDENRIRVVLFKRETPSYPDWITKVQETYPHHALLICSNDDKIRIESQAAFHNLHSTISVHTIASMKSTPILNRMRENILLLLFWIFGM